MLTALTFALSFVNIRLPLPGNGGLIHLGNIPVVAAAVVLGKKYSAAAGALGMALFDLVGGWLLWAPFTFVIRLAAGFVIGLFAQKKQGKSFVWNLAGVTLGGAIIIVGYYFTEWILYGNALAPLSSVAGNALQVFSMVVAGIPLAMTLQRAVKKAFP
jgi:uncharacterized membrane protein